MQLTVRTLSLLAFALLSQAAPAPDHTSIFARKKSSPSPTPNASAVASAAIGAVSAVASLEASAKARASAIAAPAFSALSAVASLETSLAKQAHASAVIESALGGVFPEASLLGALLNGASSTASSAKPTYTCVMNAAAENEELVGPPTPPKVRRDQSINPADVFPRGDPADFPPGSGGGSPSINTFISNTGLTIGVAGASQPLYSSSDFNVWDIRTQTISKADTGLTDDIYYYAADYPPTFNCGMQYQGVSYNCDQSDDIKIVFIGTDSTQKGQVLFPCQPAD